MKAPRIAAVHLTVFLAACAHGQTSSVPAAVMQRIFDDSQTPHKYGIVVRGENGKAVDCPRVFRFHATWYMHYVCMNGAGYETRLAISDDLLHWRTLGSILTFRKSGWDRWQADGGVALVDP